MTNPYDSRMVDGPVQPLPALYERLAEWWPLFSHPDDYFEEATFYATLLADGSRSRRKVLELGSGGGNNAFHLRRHFDMTLVDLSPAMIEVSRALNPDCEHVVGDMRTARLGEALRCGLRTRCRHVPHHRGGPASHDGDRSHSLFTRRRCAFRTRPDQGESPTIHRSRRARRRGAGPQIPGMDVGSGSARPAVRHGLRHPPHVPGMAAFGSSRIATSWVSSPVPPGFGCSKKWVSRRRPSRSPTRVNGPRVPRCFWDAADCVNHGETRA